MAKLDCAEFGRKKLNPNPHSRMDGVYSLFSSKIHVGELFLRATFTFRILMIPEVLKSSGMLLCVKCSDAILSILFSENVAWSMYQRLKKPMEATSLVVFTPRIVKCADPFHIISTFLLVFLYLVIN